MFEKKLKSFKLPNQRKKKSVPYHLLGGDINEIQKIYPNPCP